MKLFKIGTHVRDRFTGVTGTIASAPFEIKCDLMYAVKLDKPVWTEGRDMFISHIVQSADCVEEIPKA